MIVNKLRTRIIAHIIWIIAAVMIVTFYFVYKLHVKSIQQHLHTNALMAAEIMENLFFRSLHFTGPASLSYFIPELSKRHHILKIRIITSTCKLIFSSKANKKETKIPRRFAYSHPISCL